MGTHQTFGSDHTRALIARLLDSGGALTALIVLSPVLACIALVVFSVEGSPVLFRQKRVGRNGHLFEILKFRTMWSNDAAPPLLTVAGDPRITYTGAILRKFKLDELPQLVNVLRGEMSFIGPRPEMPEYVQYQDALWRSVLEVRPGITDAATLVFRDEEQLLQSAADADAYYRATLLPAKLRLALRYRESRSLPRDITLLWLTARYSLFPRNFDRERVMRALGAETP